MSDILIFGFGLAVTILVGFGLSTFIVIKNRVNDAEDTESHTHPRDTV